MAKIVLAIDESEHSERAFHYYFDMLHKAGNEVLLVHALEYPYIPGQLPYDDTTAYVRHDVVKDLFDKTREDGAKLDNKFKALCAEKEVKVTVFTEFATAGEFVVRVASEEKAKMVVMGTRGMGTIRRTILGSVSDYVVHHAHCPVLIARQ